MKEMLTGVILLSFSICANAALYERLNGAAYYDDVANLTWLADANYAGFYPSNDGRMGHVSAKNFAERIIIEGVSGWRLPDTDQSCIGTCNYPGDELGNLFYNVLGGQYGESILTTHNSNFDLFSNIQSDSYWYNQEYQTSLRAWTFDTSNGSQTNSQTTDNRFFAWPVRSGDVVVVPIPAAIWMFALGLASLVGVAKIKNT